MDKIKLEGFEIIRKIGQGGMGAVYEGRQISLERKVAIKEILDPFIDNTDFHSRFRREALLMARLDHRNIAKIYDLIKDKYIVMEFIEGKSLFQMIKEKGRLTEQEAVHIIIQAAEGLGAAHSEKIVHRDIKPQNIMINKNGVVKILDFGIARAPDLTSTTTGSIMGTLAYMSPEQAKGIKSDLLDGRTDIYSLGVTLYQAITGALPFEVDTDMDFVHKHKSEPPDPPSKYLKSIEPSLQNAILKALEKKPEDRFQKAEDFAHELKKIEKILSDKAAKKQYAKTVLSTQIATKLELENQQIEKPSKEVEQIYPKSNIDTSSGISSVPQKDIYENDELYPKHSPYDSIPDNQTPKITKSIVTFNLIALIAIAIIASIFIIKFFVIGIDKPSDEKGVRIKSETHISEIKHANNVKSQEIDKDITSLPKQKLDESVLPDITKDKLKIPDSKKLVSSNLQTPLIAKSEDKEIEVSNEKPASELSDYDIQKILNKIKDEKDKIIVSQELSGAEQLEKLSSMYENILKNNPWLETKSAAAKFFEDYGGLYHNAAAISSEYSDKISFVEKAKELYLKAKKLYEETNSKNAQEVAERIEECDKLLE